MKASVSIPIFMRKFIVQQIVPKQKLIHYSGRLPVPLAHVVGIDHAGFSSTAPIELKVSDEIWVDLRNGSVQIVERGGIAIWRAGWLN